MDGRSDSSRNRVLDLAHQKLFVTADASGTNEQEVFMERAVRQQTASQPIRSNSELWGAKDD